MNCSEFMQSCDASSVAHSNFASNCSLRAVYGASMDVECDTGYSGGGVASCSITGVFTSSPPCEPEPGPCASSESAGISSFNANVSNV